jgi:hypothetical protein
MMPGPEGIYTSAKLRPDGTVMFLHNHVLHIRDELDDHVVEIPDDMLGITGLHHELLELPNGNFMALSFTFQMVDYGPDGLLKHRRRRDRRVHARGRGRVDLGQLRPPRSSARHRAVLDRHRDPPDHRRAHLRLDPRQRGRARPRQRHPAVLDAPPGLDSS